MRWMFLVLPMVALLAAGDVGHVPAQQGKAQPGNKPLAPCIIITSIDPTNSETPPTTKPAFTAFATADSEDRKLTGAVIHPDDPNNPHPGKATKLEKKFTGQSWKVEFANTPTGNNQTLLLEDLTDPDCKASMTIHVAGDGVRKITAGGSDRIRILFPLKNMKFESGLPIPMFGFVGAKHPVFCRLICDGQTILGKTQQHNELWVSLFDMAPKVTKETNAILRVRCSYLHDYQDVQIKLMP